MDNHGAAHNRQGSIQLDELVGEIKLGHAVLAGHNVAQIADVSLLIVHGAMRLAERIKMSARTYTSFNCAEFCSQCFG